MFDENQAQVHPFQKDLTALGLAATAESAVLQSGISEGYITFKQMAR
jgi:hypothetical protein